MTAKSYDANNRSGVTLDNPLLVTLIKHGGVSLIAADTEGRITAFFGEIIPTDDLFPHISVGKMIEEVFVNDPDHVRLFRSALQGESSTVLLHAGATVLEVHVMPLKNLYGEIEGAIGFGTDVTNRENEAKLRRQREAELENLFQNSEDGIYLLDRQFVIRRANSIAVNIHAANGPLVDHVCYKRIFDRDEPCEYCPVIKTFETGKPARSSYYEPMIDKHLQLDSSPMFDPQTGELVGAFETFRDITERVRFAETIRSHETFVDTIFASIQEGMFIIDRDYVILKTNPVFEQMYAEHMPLVGKKCFVTSCLDSVCDDCPAKMMFETGKSTTLVHYEEPTDTKPGMWLEHFTHPIFSPTGEIIAGIGMIRDVTQRKENEDTLTLYRENLEALIEERTHELDEARIVAEDANELTRRMLDATPLCLNLWNENGQTLDCNLESLKLFGFTDKREYLDHFMDCSPEYQPDGRRSATAISELIATAFETGYHRFEWMHQNPDGEPIPSEITLVRIQHGESPIVLSFIRDLREAKKMSAEIDAANERARIMLDATPLCCNFWDENFNNIDCNLEAAKLFDLQSKREYLDRFRELSPEYQPDGRLSAEKAIEKVKAAFETGWQRFEWMHQKPDGTPVPAEITLVRVQRGNGHIVVGYTRDLREFKKMLAEMREADERTQIMLDATPLCCNLWDKNFDNIDCNLEAVKLFELKDKKEYLDRFFELSPPFQPCGRPTPEMAKENITAAFRDGYCRFQWMHQKLNGEPIPSEITLVRVKHGDHSIVAGYTRDLRELKKNEAALELDRLRTNALLELAQMTNEPEQEIVDFTIATGVKLTGSKIGYVVMFDPSKDLLPFRSLVYGEVQDCAVPMKDGDGNPHLLAPTLIECLEKKAAVIQDDFASLPGTRTFPTGHFEVHSHMNMPILDGDQAIGILGVGNKETPYAETDIRQLTLLAQGMGSQISRRRYAENLETARSEAENANKAKSEFLAHMSHEIRTPLNGVIGLSDLLLGTKLNEKQSEYAYLIHASGTSLLFLINDILDFSKIEAGKLEVDSEPFDLPATVESVLGILVSRAESKKLELGVSFCRNLPRIVRGDGGRIRQILLNLVGNAVKFTDHGGVRIDVTIDAIHDTGLMIRFRVIDTGIGIAKDRLDRLFKAFSQADASSARVYGGTGLGLAISLKLVHLMGGEIGVESEPGQGSTFWFTVSFGCEQNVIQCLRDDYETCPHAMDRSCPNIDGNYCVAFANRGIGGEYRLKDRTILVVDDNAIQRDTLCAQLRNWEMRCTACESGKEAFGLLKQHQTREEPFDLITIDNTLADGAGIDWMHSVVENEESSGVRLPQAILLRSLAEDVDQDYLNQIGAEALSKPVFPSALFDALMNGIFSVDRLKMIDSGVIAPDSPETGKPEKRKSHKQEMPLPRSGTMRSIYAGRIHLLVVEDNRVNQIVAKNLLAESGFECDIVNNGHEACAAVRNKHYDIVLMDCQMPEMDGYEATDLIRKWEREQGRKRIPIIALTANATKEDVQKCLNAGMDAYCSKPINPQIVLRLVEEWFEKSRMP